MSVLQKSYSKLAAAAALMIAAILNAQTLARSVFEAASIKPDYEVPNMILLRPPVGGGYTANDVSLNYLIALVYKVKPFAISGGPAWINSDRYAIEAKAADSNIADDQFRLMLQSMPADRFQLAVHRETKQAPVYALLPAKGGLKLPEAKEGGCIAFKPDSLPPCPAPGESPPIMCAGFLRAPTFLQAGKVSMTQLAGVLSDLLGRPVIDKTGFTGTGTSSTDTSRTDTSRPSVFIALQEQPGLKLESQKGPGEMLTIDRAQKPSEN